MLKLANQRALGILCIGLGLVACGKDEAVVGSGVESSSLSNTANATLGQVRLINGNYDVTSSNSECTALKAKVLGNRTIAKAESEWQTVEQTKEYEAVAADLDQFHAAGCDDQAAQTSNCKDRQAKLGVDAENLSKTPQWQTLANNVKFSDLKSDYSRGQKIGCFAALQLDE